MRIFICIIIFSFFSCVQKEEPRYLLIERELKAKVESYEKKKAKRCQQELMEEITLEVDSIMYFLVAKMNGETNIMPARPNRPGRLVDTISLETLQQK